MVAAVSHAISGAIPKLVELMEEIRKLDPEMPAQTLMTFLLVAAAGADGILQNELGPKLGMTQAAVSRNVAFLSKHKGPNLPGHGLVEAEIVPENRKLRRVKLTAKGEKLAERLGKVIA